jgi:hypothetical protein
VASSLVLPVEKKRFALLALAIKWVQVLAQNVTRQTDVSPSNAVQTSPDVKFPSHPCMKPNSVEP